MAWQRTFLLLAAICAAPTLQKSTPEDPSYKAAVVEFRPERRGDGPKTLEANTQRYVKYIETAAAQDVDIIVFPEDGITTMDMPKNLTELCDWTTAIPSPTEKYNPCTQDSMPGISKSLRDLSCAARNHGIYVQVNFAEKYCGKEKCPKDCVFYNAIIVFDRTGLVIARYRKVHPFDETQFSVTEKPELCIFKTDFGVIFGCFICFDILFHTPALNLTRGHNPTGMPIRDIAFSTAWFSELPYLTANQMQFGFSYAENVNFLGAGYNQPHTGTTGSSIYTGRNTPLAQVFKTENGDQILIAVVPKKNFESKDGGVSQEMYPAGEEQCPAKEHHVPENYGILKLLHDQTDGSFTSALITEEHIDKELCHGEFCCSFKLALSFCDQKTIYRMVAFDGIRSYGKRVRAAVQNCAVVQCVNETFCGAVTPSCVKFEKMEISGTFPHGDDVLVFPSMLNSSVLPMLDFFYDEHPHNDHTHVTISLKCPTDNLATFAVYARVFSEDPKNAALPMTVGALLIPLLVAVLYNGISGL